MIKRETEAHPVKAFPEALPGHAPKERPTVTFPLGIL